MLANTLKSGGKVGSAATEVVSDVARGVIQGASQVGGDLGSAAKGGLVGVLRGSVQIAIDACRQAMRVVLRARPPVKGVV